MIALDETYVGSMARADRRRDYPARYVRLVLGEQRKWNGGTLEPSLTHTCQMTAATARQLGQALMAEARLIDAEKKR